MTQNKPKIIGLTGGISTGKSTATKILKKKGYKVIDADVIAREILDIGQDAYKEVVKCFGDEILNRDNSINRSYLGAQIFKDKKLREKLNSITHPHIMKRIKGEIDDNSSEEILFLDIPLLIEVYESLAKSDIFIDEIWLVYCNRGTQIKRLMKRDCISYEEAELKVNAQLDIEKKRKLSDKIIDNNKSETDLTKNIEIVLEQIL